MKELNIIQTRLNAPKRRYNSFFRGNYRSAEDILEALKPLLKETGCTIVCTDEIVDVGGRLFVRATATLRNSGGEECSATGYAELNHAGAESRKKLDPAQLTGGASSYARKYALNGLFAIDDNRDPDDEEMSRIREEDRRRAESAVWPEPRKGRKMPELTSELWERMVRNEADGTGTKEGGSVRDWWIENYKPGQTQIDIFDKAVARARQEAKGEE